MRWSIGLVGERLSTGGRRGGFGGLRFGNRLIFESVADDSCASTPRRADVCRKIFRAIEGATSSTGNDSPRHGGSDASRRIHGQADHDLQLGIWPCSPTDERFSNLGKGLETQVSEVVTSPRIKKFLFFGNRPIPRSWEYDILVLSRRTSVPETKQGLRQA